MKRERKAIFKELSSAAPDVSENVKNAVDWGKVAAENTEKRNKHNPISFAYKFAMPAVCCILAVLTVVFAFNAFSNPPSMKASAYEIIIDVNPSVKLSVDENDMVIAQEGLNEDGVILLYKKDFTARLASEATKEVIGAINSVGLLKNNAVKITAIDKKTGKILKEKRNAISQTIESFFGAEDFSTVFLTDKELDEIEDYYEKHKISEYEKTMISAFKEKLVVAVNQKIAEIADLATKLAPFDKKDKTVIENFPYAENIKAFAEKYRLKLKFDYAAPRYKDIHELVDKLDDNREELEEALEDLTENPDDDDYADYLEDLLELVKEELFHEDD